MVWPRACFLLYQLTGTRCPSIHTRVGPEWGPGLSVFCQPFPSPCCFLCCCQPEVCSHSRRKSFFAKPTTPKSGRTHSSLSYRSHPEKGFQRVQGREFTDFEIQQLQRGFFYSRTVFFWSKNDGFLPSSIPIAPTAGSRGVTSTPSVSLPSRLAKGGEFPLLWGRLLFRPGFWLASFLFRGGARGRRSRRHRRVLCRRRRRRGLCRQRDGGCSHDVVSRNTPLPQDSVHCFRGRWK